VLVFLQAHGASASLATRIAKRYGPNTIEIVTKNPYRLALDVAGVGFKTADRIAHGLGIAADSPERMQAGLLQALLDETETGHVFAAPETLYRRALALLGGEGDAGPSPVTSERLQAALAALGSAGRAVIERGENEERAYVPRMFAAERRLATRAYELSRASVLPLSQGAAAAAMVRFEKESGVSLADEQRDAIRLAAERPVFILTGGPGVGKTTVLLAILSLFRQSGLTVRLAAPTGRAAKRMSAATSVEASTLHRLLEFDPQRGGSFKRDARAPIDADAVIVDEASMIDLPLADALFQAVADGTRLVIVGDQDQLPSIGPGAVLRDLIQSRVAPCVTLRRIFRQAHASQIVVNAHRIHDGEPPKSSAVDDPNGDFFIIHPKDAERATATITELVSSRIPRRFGMDPVRDIQVLTPMHRGAAGSLAVNVALQAALNPGGAALTRGQRVFRVGDKVMQLKNDYDRSIWNGDIGVVASVDPGRGALAVRFDDDRLVAYEPGALDNLTLAYACSVHKAQGSEFPAVVVPLLTQHFVMLSMNLLYTAVTRGKRLVVLVADPRAIRLALGDSRKDARHTRLAERISALAGTMPH
jgi:exodeoxyribonuclease V alpha subunit